MCVVLFSPLQPFLEENSSISETTDDQPGVAQEWHMLTSKYKLCRTQSSVKHQNWSAANTGMGRFS